jgi:ribose 5-phosphate isomerase B
MTLIFKKIAIGSDHAGIALKTQCKEALEHLGATAHDLGAFNEQPVDYPDIAQALATMLRDKTVEAGILICGSGIGMSIAINRFPYIRGALCADSRFAILARRHNDANVLVLGARMSSPQEILSCLHQFLTTPFDGGRHEARIQKLTSLGDKHEPIIP